MRALRRRAPSGWAFAMILTLAAAGCAPWPETQRDAAPSGDTAVVDARDVTAPDVVSTDVTAPDVIAPDVTATDVTDASVPDVTAADAPDVTATDVPDATDATATDVPTPDVPTPDDRPAPPPDTGVFGFALRRAGFETVGASSASGALRIRQQGFVQAARTCGRDGMVERCWTGGFVP